MINFRFHLVSLIAVFLALALGVLMGATVIDQAIVDGLRNRISNVRAEVDEQRGRNSELQDEVERLQRFVGDEYAVTGRLQGVPVGVIAPRGVDGDDARGAVELLQTAGAVAPGVLWLEEKWQLADEETRQELAGILGVTSDGVDALRTAAWTALAARPEVIPDLVESGFVEFDPVGEQGDGFDPAGYPVAGARALLIDQSDASTDANELVESVLTEFVGLGIPLVVGEVYQEEGEDGPARGARLASIRDDEELVSVVATVDDLELTEGKVTAVRAMADLPGTVGHYGLAADVDGALPSQ
ncbi:MAG: copper transporter [Acidimicrobiia bacterium]